MDAASEDGSAGDGDDLGELVEAHQAGVFAESECLLDDKDDEGAESAEAEAVDEDAGDDEGYAAEGENHQGDADGLECRAEDGHLAGAEAFAGASEGEFGCDAHGGDEGNCRCGGGRCEAVFAEVLSELGEYALVGEGCGDESDEGEPECPGLDGSFDGHSGACGGGAGGRSGSMCSAHLDFDVVGFLAHKDHDGDGESDHDDGEGYVCEFPVEECDDGCGEWGHGHAAEVVARDDNAGHASHRVREPESDHLSSRQYGCSGEAGVYKGREGVPVPEFGDEGSEGEADGDEDEGYEHDWSHAESVCPVSDDGCEDA